MEYYSAIKRNTFESVLMRWMNLELMIQWSKSERERYLLHFNAYTRNLEKWYWRIYLQGSNGETHIKNRLMDMGRGEKRVRCMERVTRKLTFSSVQFSSVAQSCPILCYPINHSMPALMSITNSWTLPKLMSIESVMPSNHLILCHPLLLLPSIFPSIKVFSSESALCIR